MKFNLQYLITGLGLAVCRHSMVLRAFNMWTGEKHGYAWNLCTAFDTLPLVSSISSCTTK